MSNRSRLEQLGARALLARGPMGASGNPKVFLDLVGPAVRGFILKKGKQLLDIAVVGRGGELRKQNADALSFNDRLY